MGQALYRKYRSQTLSEVVGQNHITSLLQKSLVAGLTSHAYLFTGPRGVGKTSVARILAGELTQSKPNETNLDIIEIDAASNNSVEDIRDLRDKVQIAPTSSPKKVYIVDEVHMLSKSAFNALLKTLEEPPAHVVFILATTNPDKLPETIISRTQHFSFKNLSPDSIKKQLKLVAKKEKLSASDDVFDMIAYQANGGMRDALSLLDQISALGQDKVSISSEQVSEALGLASIESIQSLVQAANDGNFTQIKDIIQNLSDQGVSGASLLDQLIGHILTITQEDPDIITLLDQLSKLNKREDYLDIRILTILGLYKTSPRPESVIAKDTSTATVTAKVKQKNVPLATAPATVVAELPIHPTKKARGQTGSFDSKNFDWSELIESAREKHMALASLLVKCKYELAEGEMKLILYTVNKFNKKKIDDPKYLPHLYQILQELGLDGLTVETIPSGPPPKSAEGSKIAAIMGGGEMVEVEI